MSELAFELLGLPADIFVFPHTLEGCIYLRSASGGQLVTKCFC
jgi:hypothetical protein